MSESRNIVVVLGNGFDLDLGLKTSYKDFWESEFCPKDYPAPIIRHLNSRWTNDIESVRWYDLENELLNYALNGDKTDLISESEYKYIQENNDFQLINKLRFFGVDDTFRGLFDKGLIKIFNTPIRSATIPYREEYGKSVLSRDKYAFNLIKERLCEYLKSIEKPIPDSPSVAFHMLCAFTKCIEAGNTIDIYSFNYTRLKMRSFSLEGMPIHYMHGSCEDGKVIVGTRDGIPMAREYDFLQKVMDDSFMPPDIVSALDNADEVIIFGHSLGENDRQYFEQFVTKQASGDNQFKKDLYIFTRDTESKENIKRSLGSMIGGRLSSLYSFNRPFIIRTGELEKDRQLLYSFLLNHHTEKYYVSEVIGKLLSHDE